MLDTDYIVPWRLARRVFESEYASDEPTYGLSWARSIVGITAVAATSLRFRDPGGILEEAWEKTATAAVLSLIILVVIVPAFYVLADRDGRRYMQDGKNEPLISISVAVVTLLMFKAVIAGQIQASGVANLALVCVLIWFGLFAAPSAVFAARSVFRISEVHPLVAPLSAAIVLSYMFVSELVAFDTKRVPERLWLTLGLFGFLSATIISILEVRLAWIDGHRIRGGPRSATHHLKATPAADASRRRRQQAGLVAVAVALIIGSGAFYMIYAALGGGLLTFLALAVLTVAGGRALWHAGGDSIMDLFG